MEQWILMKEYGGPIGKASLHLPGDKVYISNKGNVRFNDIILSFDFGLYIAAFFFKYW